MGLLIGVGNTKPTFPYDYYYGIEWDLSVANTACTRIGRLDLHVSLPIQSKMRRCVLRDNGTVAYYLGDNDSTITTEGELADLAGATGQVMVEIPAHWRKFEQYGTKCRCLISENALPGFNFVKLMYISAYEASIDRTTSTYKLASVVNTDAALRGGNNTEAWDGTYRSLLGCPATSTSRTNFREYARNRASGDTRWNCYTYEAHKAMFWLFTVEYATTNCQLEYNAEASTEGYKRGGLGAGVTTLSSSLWNTYNRCNPIVPCGYTNSLGNKSGVVPFVMPTEYGSALTVNVPSYRGVENPFGHVWKWTDGVNFAIQSDDDGNENRAYAANDPANYQDAGFDNYDYIGNLARSGGFIKRLLFGHNGEMLPLEIDSSSSTFWCDYFYTNIPTSGVETKGLIVGGFSKAATSCGLACVGCSYTPMSSNTYIGSRLCFIPA